MDVTTNLKTLEGEERIEFIKTLYGNVENFYDDRRLLRTNSLIREGNSVASDKYPAMFTMADTNRDGYVSLYREYLADSDPTGYTTALRVFGSWKLWKKLRASATFQSYFDAWDEELEVKVRAEAVQNMRSITNPAAAKWLAEGGWNGAKRGRPTKEKKDRDARIEAAMREELADDADRILRH